MKFRLHAVLLMLLASIALVMPATAQQPLQIRCRLSRSDETPLGKATFYIQFVGMEESGVILSTGASLLETSDRGEFVLQLLDGAIYDFVVILKRHKPARLSRVSIRSDQWKDRTLQFRVDIAKTGSVGGYVYLQDGTPAPGINVGLYEKRIAQLRVGAVPASDDGMSDWLPANATRTDEQGWFEFTDVQEGTYALLGSASYEVIVPGERMRLAMMGGAYGTGNGPGSIQYVSPPDTYRDYMPSFMEGIEVAGGDLRRCDIIITKGGTLTGLVIDKESGAPIAQQEVMFQNADEVGGAIGANARLSRAVVTDANGRFTICGLFPGAYLLAANGPEAYSTATFLGYVGFVDRKGDVRIVAARRKHITLRGQITGADGTTPLKGVRVQSMSGPIFAVTDDDGRFVVEHIEVRGDVAMVPQMPLDANLLVPTTGPRDSNQMLQSYPRPMFQILIPDAILAVRLLTIDGQTDDQDIALTREGTLQIQLSSQLKPPRTTSFRGRILSGKGMTPIDNAVVTLRAGGFLGMTTGGGLFEIPRIAVIEAGNIDFAQLESVSGSTTGQLFRTPIINGMIGLRIALPDGRRVDLDVKLDFTKPAQSDFVIPDP